MPVNEPAVLVPADPKMATEPAREVGKQFAGLATVKMFIGALIVLLATLGVVLPEGTPQALEDVITYGSPLAVAVYGWWQLRRQAKDQAEKTREAVFAPATVASMVAESQDGAETVEAVVVPAPAADEGVRRFPRTAMDPDGDGVVDL